MVRAHSVPKSLSGQPGLYGIKVFFGLFGWARHTREQSSRRAGSDQTTINRSDVRALLHDMAYTSGRVIPSDISSGYVPADRNRPRKNHSMMHHAHSVRVSVIVCCGHPRRYWWGYFPYSRGRPQYQGFLFVFSYIYKSAQFFQRVISDWVGLEPATLRLLSRRFYRLSQWPHARASLQGVVITSHCLIFRHRTSVSQWFEPTQFQNHSRVNQAFMFRRYFLVYLSERNTPGNNLHVKQVPIRQQSTVPMPERFYTTWLSPAVVLYPLTSVRDMCRLTETALAKITPWCITPTQW